ncbi:MAG: hypothetical protein NTX03_08145 [Bacteroidetes bacterium]|nr:hypothetical protein [Bacteroidota bacterium]
MTKKFLNQKVLVVLMFLVLSIMAYSQDCKYELNVVDKFTGAKSIITDSKQGRYFYSTLGGAEAFFQIVKNASEFSIFHEVVFNSDTKESFKIEKGQHLILLLASNDTVCLTANETRIGPNGLVVQSVLGGVSYTSVIKNSYTLTTSQAQKITSSNLKSVRTEYEIPDGTKRNFDINADKKKVEVLIKIIGCVNDVK